MRESLGSIVDLMAHVPEGLRPPLLHNIGLVAAVRELALTRCRSPVILGLDLPDKELQLRPSVSISVYRFIDEALILACRCSASVRLSMVFEEPELKISLSHDGQPIVGRRGDLSGWLSMNTYIHIAGGALAVSPPGPGETFHATVPIEAAPNLPIFESLRLRASAS
jgi:signal transduction histidine kinase